MSAPRTPKGTPLVWTPAHLQTTSTQRNRLFNQSVAYHGEATTKTRVLQQQRNRYLLQLGELEGVKLAADSLQMTATRAAGRSHQRKGVEPLKRSRARSVRLTLPASAESVASIEGLGFEPRTIVGWVRELRGWHDCPRSVLIVGMGRLRPYFSSNRFPPSLASRARCSCTRGQYTLLALLMVQPRRGRLAWVREFRSRARLSTIASCTWGWTIRPQFSNVSFSPPAGTRPRLASDASDRLTTPRTILALGTRVSGPTLICPRLRSSTWRWADSGCASPASYYLLPSRAELVVDVLGVKTRF